MKKALPFLAILIVIPLIVFFYTKRKKYRTVEKTFLYFDTFVHITCHPPKEINIDNLFTCIDDELERIHARYGYQSGSFCRQRSIHHDTMTLSEEDNFILAKSLELSRVTDGAFDISVGLLENIWGFRGDKPHLPKEEEIQSALFRTGYQYILLADDKAILAKTGMVIDLGGISKGYAVDRVVTILRQEGISSGIVDAGGDLRVFGDKPDGRKWAIGIRDPVRAGSIAKTIYINEGAVATSGNYERCFIRDGKRYHHIFNPLTGYPANGCISVTIIAKEALVADALATGIFVLGPEKGMKLIENLHDVEGVIIYEEEGRVTIISSKGVDMQ